MADADKTVLTPDDLKLIEGHSELQAEIGRLADARSLLKTADKQRAALEAQVAQEQSDLDAELRASGRRGRGPLPATPGKAQLTALNERVEAAREQVRYLPAAIEGIRKRLADHLLLVRGAERTADRVNADLRKAAVLAKEMLAIGDGVQAARSMNGSRSRALTTRPG